MKPKEKAKELIKSFYNDTHISDTEAKENAIMYSLICVNEIINCDSYFKTLEDSKIFVKY